MLKTFAWVVTILLTIFALPFMALGATVAFATGSYQAGVDYMIKFLGWLTKTVKS